MAHDNSRTVVLCSCAVTIIMLAGSPVRADDTATQEKLRQLKEANKALQEQLRQQLSLIESLSRKVNQIEQAESQKGRDLDRLESEVKDGYATAKPAGNFSFGKVSLSGEGGAGFFNTGSQGAFPKSEFRVTIERVKFEKPGKVDVFCSIHSRMSCIILVLENPYYATSNDKGHYSITNVPAGTYKLKAWHERLPSQVKEITVPESGEIKVDFTLGITNLPKP
jgi:hypothetical protein